jgi:hypothetical protein
MCVIYLQKTCLSHKHFRSKTVTRLLRNQTMDKAEHVLFYGLAALVVLGQHTVEAARSQSDTPHSVWLFRTCDGPVAATSTWQHTTLTGHISVPPGGIWTHSLSKRTAADPCLKPFITCWSFVISFVYIRNCYGWELLRNLEHNKRFPVKLTKSAFLKLCCADHKWSSGSALVVLLDWTLVQKRQKNININIQLKES